MFAPDLIAVVDVGPGKRQKWVVANEKGGIDLVLEVNVSGNYAKDVEWPARLGIPEYFVYFRCCGAPAKPGTVTACTTQTRCSFSSWNTPITLDAVCRIENVGSGAEA